MSEVKFSSGDWCKLTGVVVMDPDGWDRSASNYEADWNKEISFSDFYNRACMSTARGVKDFKVFEKELGL